MVSEWPVSWKRGWDIVSFRLYRIISSVTKYMKKLKYLKQFKVSAFYVVSI